MQQPKISSLFPETLQQLENPLTEEEFQQLSYFSSFGSMLSTKQYKAKVNKSMKCFKLIKVKKGTVLYNFGENPDRGYIILNGCITVLSKKNIHEKVQNYPGHVAHTPLQKIQYLHKKFHIPQDKAQFLINSFYEQKIFFKFLHFTTLYGDTDFGFGQMIRNSTRTQTMITQEDSQLLVIDKRDFQKTLREFQEKKQNQIINRIIGNLKGQWVEDLQLKLKGIFNSAFLLKFNNEDLVYEEKITPYCLFYVLEGEIQFRRRVSLEMPKKFKNQGEVKQNLQKQAVIKIARISMDNFVGEHEILQYKKQRQFSTFSMLNNTILLKIQHTSFLKAISDFPHFQKQLINNARLKTHLGKEKLDQQSKNIKKKFYAQCEQFDSKKRQKLFSNFLNDEFNEKNQEFQVFAPEGIFYRDTFQKLEGFDLAQKLPKKQVIKRVKAKDGGKSMEKKQNSSKLILSPKRNLSPVDFIENQQKIQIPQTPPSIQKQRPKHYKSLGKFQGIKRDENVYKRVLIKYGKFPINKNIDKSKSTKPLIHKDFDSIIKECITRKNQGIKRVNKDRQQQIIKQSYQKTVENLKRRGSSSLGITFSRFSTPCKGTQEMRKRIENPRGKILESEHRSRHKQTENRIELLKVNKPGSSQIGNRFTNTAISQLHRRNSPQKVVLLNHMMKPITYFNSVQL